ncbi:hypothetical protein P4S64_16000 [Vibrio sp. M60_M31a]
MKTIDPNVVIPEGSQGVLDPNAPIPVPMKLDILRLATGVQT